MGGNHKCPHHHYPASGTIPDVTISRSCVNSGLPYTTAVAPINLSSKSPCRAGYDSANCTDRTAIASVIGSTSTYEAHRFTNTSVRSVV